MSVFATQRKFRYACNKSRQKSIKTLNIIANYRFVLAVKVMFTLEEATKAEGGVEVLLYSFFSLDTKWGGWSTPRSGRFNPRKDLVTIVQEVGCASQPVWTGAKNLAPTEIRSSDRPAHSKSLYGLSYHGTCLKGRSCEIC